MAKQSAFQKQVLSRLEGKSKAQTAEQIERLAKANINGQIHALEGSVVHKEMAVTTAKEALDNAKYPTSIEALSNADSYIKGIVEANKAVAKAEKDLQGTKDLANELKDILKSFDVEA